MDKPTVTSEELKRMAEQSYQRLGGVAQPDARVIRGLLARIQELETAGRELLDVCHCTNDCRPDDMSCATNKMLAALYGIENVSKYRAALLNNTPLEKE